MRIKVLRLPADRQIGDGDNRHVFEHFCSISINSHLESSHMQIVYLHTMHTMYWRYYLLKFCGNMNLVEKQQLSWAAAYSLRPSLLFEGIKIAQREAHGGKNQGPTFEISLPAMRCCRGQYWTWCWIKNLIPSTRLKSRKWSLQNTCLCAVSMTRIRCACIFSRWQLQCDKTIRSCC